MQGASVAKAANDWRCRQGVYLCIYTDGVWEVKRWTHSDSAVAVSAVVRDGGDDGRNAKDGQGLDMGGDR